MPVIPNIVYLMLFLFFLFQCANESYMRIRGIMYILNTAGQLYILTLTCDSLADASSKISHAAYDVRWFSIKSDRIKKELIFGLKTIIMRSQRPCQMTVGNFTPVTLNTFTTVSVHC